MDEGAKPCSDGRSPSQLWPNSPNLLLRPHAPNAGRGRLQRQIARAFAVHGPVVSATTIYDWCALWPVDKRRSPAQRWSVRRILDVVAERTGRATTIGRPWIWTLKAPAADSLPRRKIEIIDEICRWPIQPIVQTMFGARKGVYLTAPGDVCSVNVPS
jgi:hypothetical protein